MKKIALTMFALASTILFSAHAFGQVGQFMDMAKVVNVQPLMQQPVQQDCYQQPMQVQAAPERSNTGGVIGGLAGALLGSQVGGGNGRIAAAAVGTLLGAMTGDRVDNRGNQQQQNQAGYMNAGCNTRSSNQSLAGYLVTFDYNGRQGQKRMQYDPGQTVKVLVSVDPQ